METNSLIDKKYDKEKFNKLQLQLIKMLKANQHGNAMVFGKTKIKSNKKTMK